MNNQSSSFSMNKTLKTISKIVSWALFVILLLVALFLFYYYIATKIYAAKGPGYEPKFSIYTIISGSMHPNIKVYDTIVNVRVDNPEDIKVNDVITFISTSLLSPGTTITHRVIGITKDEKGNICYQTKGDNNTIADQACAKFSNVLGKVIIKIPQLGRIQFFLASKAGWLICILVPALIIIIRDVLRITKLSTIKSTVQKMDQAKQKDPKKVERENMRKNELKKRLIRNDDSTKEYYQEPKMMTIEKGKRKN